MDRDGRTCSNSQGEGRSRMNETEWADAMLAERDREA